MAPDRLTFAAACAALLISVLPAFTAVQFTVIEDFDDGAVTLGSWPGEDGDPSGWILDPNQGRNGSPFGLRLTGNTWKTEAVGPLLLDSASRWSVSAKILQTGELQGFGIADSARALFFAFAGTEEADPGLWVTTHQGAFATGSWTTFTLPVGEEWLSRYGYLPAVTRIIFINDRDTDPAADIVFDDIREVTDDQPHAPVVEIACTTGTPQAVAEGMTTVEARFTSTVTDPDGAPHAYLWRFGDGAVSTDPHPVHTYTVTDDHAYTVLLEVRDQTNRWGRAACRVVVDPGAGRLPVRMNFVGDVMLARGYETAGGIIPTRGVEAIFAPTRPFLGDAADITVANLECPLTSSGTPHPTKPIVFRGSPANAAGLAYAGIDVVTLANNHILDYGLPGIEETRSVLAGRSIGFSGAGADVTEAERPLFVSRSGLSIAFLASSDRTGQYNNYQPYLQAGEGKPGFAELTPYRLAVAIAGVRPLADAVITEMHSGSEYSAAPDAEGDSFRPAPAPAAADRDVRRGAIDAGADLVICHHPHILHGVEVYRGRVIAHSLGNFTFDLSYAETHPSAILSAALDTSGFRDFRLLPVFIDDFIPRRATGDLGRHVLDNLAMKSRELGTILLVRPDSGFAEIVLDTTRLLPRDRTRTLSAPLRVEGSARVSAPIPLAVPGSLRRIDALQPAGTWLCRTGRDIVWFGAFEDEGATPWAIDDTDESLDSTVRHGGLRSLRQRRAAGAGEITTRLERRAAAGAAASDYSVYAWMKTSGARNARVRASFWSSRTGGAEIGAADLPAMVQGTGGWTFLHGTTASPLAAAFADFEMRSSGPTLGTGEVWCDDAGIIEWSEWQAWNPGAEFPLPSDTRWLQVRTSASVTDVQVTYSERTFTDALEPARITLSLHEGWNLVSNPLAQEDSLTPVPVLFPAAAYGAVYGFSGATGYRPSDVCAPGTGYWAKFPAASILELTGPPLAAETVRIHEGWNILGSVSSPVDTSLITALPPGIIASVYYGYAPGYFPVEQIVPGSAVWVKAAHSGELVLTGGLSRRRGSDAPPFSTLRFEDASGFAQTLLFTTTAGSAPGGTAPYTLPPPPPEGAPDVRFSDGTLLAAAVNGSAPHGVTAVGLRYPVTITWNHAGPGAPVLHAGASSRALTGAGRWILPREPGSLMLTLPSAAVPEEFSLSPFYPNPFNSASTAGVSIAAPSLVRAVLFDILGRQVEVLAEEVRVPGTFPLRVDGTRLASGVYFCRLSARPLSGGPAFTALRKLILLR